MQRLLRLRETAFFVISLLVFGVLTFDHNVEPHCSPEEEVCEFDWVIDYVETMIRYGEDGGGNPIVVRNGSLFERTSCNDYIPYKAESDSDDVIFGDGSYKMIFAINRQFPGPSVVVYEGQQVVVNIKNNLLMEGITIHWHGMVQWHTPWMDGVGTVSQCPINPGETFQYRFLADPVGTHWYHSHLGTERTDGISGALIVLPKPESPLNLRADLPEIKDEYAMILTDWKLDASVEIKNELDWGISGYSYGFNESRCYSFTSDAAGGGVGLTLFESGLMNGKGHHYLNKENPEQTDIPDLPYETFVVNRFENYRFRVVNVGMMFGFRVSIDQHTVQVVAVDGNDVVATAAESFVINGGERVDFVVLADQNADNYWIRVETLEVSDTQGPTQPNSMFGILRYNGSATANPRTNRAPCSSPDHCKVINCPFGQYPERSFTDCVSISDLKATPEQRRIHPVPNVTSENEFQEVFLNFHFSSTASIPFTAAVNGRVFEPPTSPPQIYPKQVNTTTSCDNLDCTDHCQCTHIVKLEKDKTVQVVLLNMDDAPFGMPHPIHMHGHHFHVLKTGYPEYNTTTGRIIARNPDILCTTPSCNTPIWRNESWQFGNIPGLNLEDPPEKDTIIVPRNGYLVLRLKSDNPGFWFMHCHIEVHQIAGMAVLLQEGDVSEMEPVPDGYPTCGSYKMTNDEFKNYMKSDVVRKEKSKHQQPRPVVREEVDMYQYEFLEVDHGPPKPYQNGIIQPVQLVKGSDHHVKGYDHYVKGYDHHIFHKRGHIIVLVVLGLSLLLNFVFVTICICKKCRRSSVHPLKDKGDMYKNNLVKESQVIEPLSPTKTV